MTNLKTMLSSLLSAKIMLFFLLVTLVSSLIVGETLTLEPSPKNIPEPRYDMHRLEKLHRSNRWIQSEKIRIYCGWPMSTYWPRIKKDFSGNFFEFLDKVAEAGFNVALIGDIGNWNEKDWSASFDCPATAALYARLKGLRVIWHMGYLYRKPAEKAAEEIGTKYGEFMTRTGQVYKACPCPLDEKLWQDRFENSILKALAWEKEHNVRISCGCHLDVEPQCEQEECLCNRCFSGFLKTEGLDEQALPKPDERFAYLTDNQLLEDYHLYLSERLISILTPLRERVLKASGRPGYLFSFYPGHVFDRAGWMCRAMARALGNAEAPVLLWDDAMYWNGYTGSYKHILKNQEAMRQYLGYEPLYLPSIDYVLEDIRYPTYTPERAAHEMYLLNCSSPGTFCFGEKARGKTVWESHEPYWPVFKEMNERLLKNGLIKSIGLHTPWFWERMKLQALKESVDQRIRTYSAARESKEKKLKPNEAGNKP